MVKEWHVAASSLGIAALMGVAAVALAQSVAPDTAAADLASVEAALDARLDALEANSVTQAQLTSAASGLDSRLDVIEATDYETQAEADASHATMMSSISTNTSAISSMSSQVATLATSSSVTALTSRVAALEANSATTTALNAAIAALQKRACGSASLSGISVPLAGISTETAITIANVPVGTSCTASTNNFMPLGARPEAVVTVAGTVRLRFVSNAGLLSIAIAIPSGTYRVCCDL